MFYSTKARVALYLILILVSVCMRPISANLPVWGIILLFTTIDSLIFFRQKGFLFMLLAVLSIANLSLVYGCFWFYENNVYSWQVPLVGTSACNITAQALTVFYVTMMLSLIFTCKKKANTLISIYDLKKYKWQIGTFFFVCCYIFLIYILIFCFNRSVSEYTSGKSVLYEYAVVLYIIMWLYMPARRIYKVLMLLYAFLYIMQGLLFGDRSSAFPMLILLYFLLQRKPKRFQFVALSLLGVLGANFIGIYRRAFTVTSDIFDEIISRFFYVDSIAYSFYTGVQIVSASDIIHNKFQHFMDWFLHLFIGGTSEYDLSTYVSRYSDAFYNTGGGMTSSYLYFWAGMFGVILGGLIIGIILGKIYSNVKGCYPFLQIVIILFALRWYTYFPSVFFRTCIIIPIVLYFGIMLVNSFFNRIRS